MALISQECLKKVLEYSPETGIFTFRVSRGNRRAGATAGNVQEDGYVRIRLNDSLYLAHRLAFLFMTGSHPVGVVDHRNGNTSDNRWENLRDVSRAENVRNRGIPVNNTSGYHGVCFHKQKQRWHAQIYIDGKNHHIGLYDTPEAAHAAYARMAEDLGYSLRHIYGVSQ